jgi:hypothetical protein
VEHVVNIEKIRNACTILIEEPDRNRPFEKRRRRCEDNIKMDLREI